MWNNGRMEKDIIQEKLRGQLGNLPINTEARVVYFLVQVRKVLDHLDDRDDFNLLRLYADWCVHTSLNRRLARKLFKIISKGDTESSKNLNFGRLQTELGVFLEMYELPTEIVRDSDSWSDLKSNLLNVLIDSPIFYKRENGTTDFFQFKNNNKGVIEYEFLVNGKKSFGRILL